MNEKELSLAQLEELAARMAAAIPDLDCPECCECTWVYHYVERSATLYQEELEWALLVHAFRQHRQRGPQQAQ
ncbi:hypothetical protein [Noviherbaspirillum galbum]|uniref:Uncharacterized protein n=1 Tax=Noviherbaspirillum galbum TaxID=2709383 RepID=A0A6B3SWV8_9BURK|nr:hypothetical protein [Noviherbaspirillum galbum]NEX62239.1 hypothetical protein [Noviherbaspirillum galbum]